MSGRPQKPKLSIFQRIDRYLNQDKRTYLLYQAIRIGKLEEVKKALKLGADINPPLNKFDESPLHLAILTQNLDIVKELINKGAEVNARCITGQIPLHYAAQCGALKLVQVLIEKGAEVNIEAKDGTTPLHNAASLGHLAVVKELIKAGANLDKKNRYGTTALDVAVGEMKSVLESASKAKKETLDYILGKQEKAPDAELFTETNLAMLQKLLPYLLEKPQTLPAEMHKKIFGKEAEGLSDGQAVDRYINNLDLPDGIKDVIKASSFARELGQYNDHLLKAAGAILPGLMGEFEQDGKIVKLDGIPLPGDAARISETLELSSRGSDGASNLLTKATALMAAYDRNSMVTTLVTGDGTKITIKAQGTPRDLIGKILGSGEHALQVPGENRTLAPLTDAAGLSVSSKMELVHAVLALEHVNFKGDTELFALITPHLPMEQAAEINANARAASALHALDFAEHTDTDGAAAAGAGARDGGYDHARPGGASFDAAHRGVDPMRDALGRAGAGGAHDDSIGSARNAAKLVAEAERRRLEEHGASSASSSHPRKESHSHAPASPGNSKSSPGLG